MKFSITENGMDKALSGLAKSQRITPPIEKALKMIARDLDAYAKLRVRAQADPQDKPYAPLAESTLESKRRRKKRDQLILVDEGRMLAGIITRVKGLMLEFGDNMRYLHFHQFGAKYLPKRSVFPVFKRSISAKEIYPDIAGNGGKFWVEARKLIEKALEQ